MRLQRFLPFLEWIPRYKRADLRDDLLAGFTVGVLLVPQGMAYGLLAGLPPVYGLYAGIVPLFIYALLGTSRQLSVGPAALMSLLVLAGVSSLAEPGSADFIRLAIAVGLLAGGIQLLLGLFRLGFLINFLSHPVISGFISAAAFIIGLSQLRNLFGIDMARSNRIQVVIREFFQHIAEINWPTFALGMGGILFIYFLKKWNKNIPGALLAVLIGTIVVWKFQLADYGVDIVGAVPAGFPDFAVPGFSLEEFKTLLPLAMTIGVISFVESLAIARAFEKKYKTYKIQPDQELIALGLSKMGGAFFQSFPSTASFTRSAINDEAGAKSGIASMITAIVLALTLVFLTPLFYYLPKALLASIIVVAVIGLVDYPEARRLWKTDRRDFYTLLATFLATLTLGIQAGVFTGLILSLAIMVYRNSRPHLAVLGRLPNTQHFRNVNRFADAIQQDEVLIVRFDAQLYFGNVAFFQEALENLIDKQGEQLKLFILDASNVHDIDSSGIHTLEEVIDYLDKRDISLYLSGLIGPVRDSLSRHELIGSIGIRNCFLSVQDALDAYYSRSGTPNPSDVLQDQWLKGKKGE